MNELYIEPNLFENYTFKEISSECKRYKYYYKAKEETDNAYTIEDIKKIIYNSNLEETYINQMMDFNTEILYKSDGHGINHNIRVCFFAYIISTNEKISKREFELIMEACKYHDIGRINDYEDEQHGKRSADKLIFLHDKYTEEELNYIKTIVTSHSRNDKDFDKIATKNKVKDINKCKKLHEILKDSDGLDRVRLHYPYVNIKYLRTDTARSMIPFAHELYSNYDKRITIKNIKKLVIR